MCLYKMPFEKKPNKWLMGKEKKIDGQQQIQVGKSNDRKKNKNNKMKHLDDNKVFSFNA